MVVIILCLYVLMSVEMRVKLKFLSCLIRLHETGTLTPAIFNHSADLSRRFLVLFLPLRFVTLLLLK